MIFEITYFILHVFSHLNTSNQHKQRGSFVLHIDVKCAESLNSSSHSKTLTSQ